MVTSASLHNPATDRLLECLKEGIAKLDAGEAELMLDFSSVPRLDPAVLKSLENLALRAEEKSLKPVLRGVDVASYKVLKLARLTSRFSFSN